MSLDIVIIFVIVLILGVAIRYMIKSKARGVNCIGCPDAGTCKKKSCH